MSEIQKLKLDLAATKTQLKMLHNTQEAHQLVATPTKSSQPHNNTIFTPKKDSQLTLLLLNESVLLRIFSNLELVDLVALSSVCRLFHRISKSRTLWEGFYSFYATNCESILSILFGR